MYLYLCISGTIFVTLISILINFIYEIYPINKITNFLKKYNSISTWDKINTNIFPTLIWFVITLPTLSKNSNYSYSLILNILITLGITYIIKTTYYIVTKRENNIINIIAIICSSVLSEVITYILLKLGKNIDPSLSLITTSILLIIYIIINLYPPKIKFFNNKN